MADHAWQKKDLVEEYLSGTRAALPLAGEQLDAMLHVVRRACPAGVASLLDLGCGDGVLGRLLMERYPAAQGVFVDFSEPMLDAAREKVDTARAKIIQADLREPAWWDALPRAAVPFDVIVSGYAIHHLSNERKQELYRQIFYLLKPGGVFVNIDYVAAPDDWTQELFNEALVDNLFARSNMSRENIVKRVAEDIDDDDILTLVEVQCHWLRETGFTHVDIFMKIYTLAVFGGIKPTGLA